MKTFLINKRKHKDLLQKKKKLDLRNKRYWKENIKREEDEMFKKIIEWRKCYNNIKEKVFGSFACLLFKKYI